MRKVKVRYVKLENGKRKYATKTIKLNNNEIFIIGETKDLSMKAVETLCSAYLRENVEGFLKITQTEVDFSMEESEMNKLVVKFNEINDILEEIENSKIAGTSITIPFKYRSVLKNTFSNLKQDTISKICQSIH